MEYVKRHGEETVRRLASFFGAVLVTGARQVGKTTLLEKVIEGADPPVKALSMDSGVILKSAAEEPAAFFSYNKPPVFLDEVQYAPGLFPEMKRIIDKEKKRGLFYMTGSQQFHLMKDVTESLAGRVGLVILPGLSLREISRAKGTTTFVPERAFFEEYEDNSGALPKLDPDEVWRIIQRGSMPALYGNPEFPWEQFWGSYIRTYIERDVRSLTQIGDELKFMNFMTVIAGRTGQLLNLSAAANDAGISNKTAERWLSILRTSNLVYLLQPYHANSAKRVVKTPKLYFVDTGLAAYLTRWNTSDVLRNGAMAGPFFETFVVTEILKSYYNSGILDPPLYFYRDKNDVEIDLLILRDGVIYPIEIKKTVSPDKKDIKAFSIIDEWQGVHRGSGGVVCLCDTLLPLKGEDCVIPVTMV